MMLQDFLTQMRGIDVGVDLSGGDRLMPQHGLDGTEIGTTFEQRGGKRMTESVWRNCLLNACFCYKFLNHQEHHHPSERFLTAITDKHIILIFKRNGQCIATFEIEPQLMDGFLGDGYQALLRTFAFHLDELLIKKKVTEFQVDQFGHSEPATEQSLNDGLVAVAFKLAEINDGLNRINLFHREHIRQMLGNSSNSVGLTSSTSLSTRKW